MFSTRAAPSLKINQYHYSPQPPASVNNVIYSTRFARGVDRVTSHLLIMTEILTSVSKGELRFHKNQLWHFIALKYDMVDVNLLINAICSLCLSFYILQCHENAFYLFGTCVHTACRFYVLMKLSVIYI